MVSVIIPNYNHAKYLPQRIDSVLRQSYQNFELIILDDCSTDNSKEIIEKYKTHPKVTKILYNDENSGSTFKQWQKGIGVSNGDLIWIAESDDKSHVNFLSELIECFEDDQIGLAYSQSYKIDSNDKVHGDWKFYTNDLCINLWESNFTMNGVEFIKNFMFYKNPIPNASAVLFKKLIYKQCGGINSEFKLNGDWFLYSKLLLISNIKYISTPLNYFREHQNKGSSTNIKNGNNIKEYYILIQFWKTNLKIDAAKVKRILTHIFNIWYYQSERSVYKMITKNSFKILNIARKVDCKIFLKIAQKIIKI